MTDLRTAAQQALEAMEYTGLDVGKFNRINSACAALRAALAQEQPASELVAWRNPVTDDIVSAERRKEWESGCYGLAAQGSAARFTEPLYAAPPQQPAPELVAWLRVIDEAMVTHCLGIADPADDYETAKSKMTSLLCFAQDIGAYFASPPEQPAPEPVAWIQPDHLQKARVAPFLSRVEPTQRCADFVPLYLAPPQRPLLTDEEIDECFESVMFNPDIEPTRKLIARAIERAVRGEA